MKIGGTHCAPLLLRQAHIGKVENSHLELVIEELNLQGIVAQRMKLITKMKVMVVAHEHPNPIKNEDPKEKEANKYFQPKLLAAAD